MRNLVYTIALILIIGWMIGFFAFHLGPIIHILLGVAFFVLVLRIFGERKVIR